MDGTGSPPPEGAAGTRRWTRPALMVAVAVGAALLLLGRYAAPGRPAEPLVIFPDSVPDPAAIGMCALNRASGLLEGRIVAVGAPTAAGAPRYRVRPLDTPAAEYLLTLAAVQVIRCP